MAQIQLLLCGLTLSPKTLGCIDSEHSKLMSSCCQVPTVQKCSGIRTFHDQAGRRCIWLLQPAPLWACVVFGEGKIPCKQSSCRKSQVTKSSFDAGILVLARRKGLFRHCAQARDLGTSLIVIVNNDFQAATWLESLNGDVED